MALLTSYTAVAYNGRAFDIVGDVTRNLGYPEMTTQLAYRSGNSAIMHYGVDLNTGRGMASFQVSNTPLMAELLGAIKTENASGITGTLQFIDNTGMVFIAENAILRSTVNENISPNGNIPVELEFDPRNT